MDTIAELTGIEPKTVAKLRREEIETMDSLWQAIGRDFSPGLTHLAKKARLSKRQVLEVFIAHLLRRLARKGSSIVSCQDVWQFIGQDPDAGIDKLATLLAWHDSNLPTGELPESVRVEKERLIALLSAMVELEVEEGNFFSWPEEQVTSPRRPNASLRANWLEAIIILGVIVLAVLTLRALGWLPRPLDPGDPILIAARDLDAGTVIREADLVGARFGATDAFTDTSQLHGLLLANALEKGGIVRRSDVVRLQAVASKDIPVTTLFTRDNLTVTWSAFQPNAVLDKARLVGHKALGDVRSGQVVTSDLAESTPALVEHLVVSGSIELPAFHIMSANDVKSAQGPPVEGSFRTENDVIGRYALEPLAPGVTLRTEQMSQARLSPEDVLSRRALSVLLPENAATLSVQQGAHVSLLLSPKVAGGSEKTPSNAKFELVEDVIILDARSNDGRTTVFVAVKTDDLAVLADKLGSSEVYVIGWLEQGQ